jgi:hypothetical protein
MEIVNTFMKINTFFRSISKNLKILIFLKKLFKNLTNSLISIKKD